MRPGKWWFKDELLSREIWSTFLNHITLGNFGILQSLQSQVPGKPDPLGFIQDSKWIKHIPRFPLSTSEISKVSNMVLPSFFILSSLGISTKHPLSVVGASGKLPWWFCKWRHWVPGRRGLASESQEVPLVAGLLPPTPGKADHVGPGAPQVL